MDSIIQCKFKCKEVEAKSFKYGTKSCECKCYSEKCLQSRSIQDFVYYTLEQEKIEENSNILTAKIMDVTYLGELSIGFSNEVDLKYLKDENRKFIIDSKMIDIMIKPSD